MLEQQVNCHEMAGLIMFIMITQLVPPALCCSSDICRQPLYHCMSFITIYATWKVGGGLPHTEAEVLVKKRAEHESCSEDGFQGL